MNNVLAPVLGQQAVCYLDDVIVHSADWDTHLRDLEDVLAIMQQAGFKLSLPKCHFGKPEVTFLGYVVSAQGIKPNPEKVRAIQTLYS